MPASELRLLSAELLAQEAGLVREFREKSRRLGIGLGWHYLLDLSWAARLLDPHREMWVLDAGAGLGLIQWWLADRGANVLSVDRVRRNDLPVNLRIRHSVTGWRNGDLGPMPAPRLRNFLPPRSPLRWKHYPQKLAGALAWARAAKRRGPQAGTVHISQQDLTALCHVEDESMDAVVSISALEHNPLEDLTACVAELWRVLKPGGRLIATVSAARDKDWFHEPSKGWCLTEETLRRVFSLPEDCPSNFGDYEEILAGLRGSNVLKAGLDKLYFRSGDNGMPWGIWDPRYVPIGVMRTK